MTASAEEIKATDIYLIELPTGEFGRIEEEDYFRLIGVASSIYMDRPTGITVLFFRKPDEIPVLDVIEMELSALNINVKISRFSGRMQ